MFEEFDYIYKNRLDYATAWKNKTGKRVLGYFCTYQPEEILYAADVLPIRILGSHEIQDVTEPHIHSGMYCPFSRDVLAQGLEGKYDFLDGIMMTQSCLHLRQAFFAWQIHKPAPFMYYLPHPMHVQSPRAIPYLKSELTKFKKAVEDWTDKTITDDDLRRGIEIMNKNRRLMKEVYELRKQANPPVTGVEAMKMVIASQFSDKREHSKLIEALLPDLKEREPNRTTGVRLMIFGSENDDFPFMEMVENLGATFVIEDHCTGSRYFWVDVDEEKAKSDPLEAIAERYVKRIPCPSKDWPDRTRGQHLLKLAKDYNVQGAIIIQQKFCDPHECDIPPLRWLLESNGIPCYFLEFDVTVPLGQFKIRVEAFLEQLTLDI
ncbi:MAG: 2-hydroxyacyl-CoA dehydratase [Chloroflexi bacterium]|nr:2-hydroxyacyl-CoA dehydratase [Chloroflexota bacterium]